MALWGDGGELGLFNLNSLGYVGGRVTIAVDLFGFESVYIGLRLNLGVFGGGTVSIQLHAGMGQDDRGLPTSFVAIIPTSGPEAGATFGFSGMIVAGVTPADSPDDLEGRSTSMNASGGEVVVAGGSVSFSEDGDWAGTEGGVGLGLGARSL